MYDVWLLHTGEPTDVAHIESIEVSPDPPEKGKELTVKVQGTAQQAIVVSAWSGCSYSFRVDSLMITRSTVSRKSHSQDGAYADVTVKIKAIKILQKRVDICEEA